jgi:hypothetical protein
MTTEILVCLETSPSCEAAIGFAIAAARAAEGRLVGLAIVDEPDIRAGAAMGIGGASFKHERDDALVAEARKHAAAWMEAFMRRCEAAKVPARPQVIVGRAAASILAEMQAHDLTVLGREANFHFETDEVDLTTRDTILHKAQSPVILVPVNGGSAEAERRTASRTAAWRRGARFTSRRSTRTAPRHGRWPTEPSSLCASGD